jgi:hypothetical protein
MVRGKDQLRNGFPPDQRRPQARTMTGVEWTLQLKFDFTAPLGITGTFSNTNLDRKISRHETRTPLRIQVDGRSQSGMPALHGEQGPMQTIN